MDEPTVVDWVIAPADGDTAHPFLIFGNVSTNATDWISHGNRIRMQEEERWDRDGMIGSFTDENIGRGETMTQESINTDKITLDEVLYCLGAYLKTEAYPEGIVITNNLGNHVHCYLGTNCPEAVKIRKIMEDSGITKEDLASAYRAYSNPEPQPPFKFTLPSLSGKATVKIGGQSVDLDLEKELEGQVENIAANRWSNFLRNKEIFQQLERDLFYTYLHHVLETKKVKGMMQLQLPIADLTKYQATTTTNGKDCYWIIMPFTYSPKYITTRGVRYRIAKEDADKIYREIHIVFVISPARVMFAPFLILDDGVKFQHYHGDGHDCWGHIELRRRWDGSLKSLYEYRLSLESALATVNRDSPLTSIPAEMPTLPDMFTRATELGREGEFTKGNADKDRAFDEEQAKNTSDKKEKSTKVWGVK